jgi:60 kDa SS-A/Ro ribonucleoprotein
LNPRDSLASNVAKLMQWGGGGTDVRLPLAQLNHETARGDLVVYVSDNQSWADTRPGQPTQTMQEWAKFRQRNPRAKLACIDLQPYANAQATEREDILNIGGFSDSVMDLLAQFAGGEMTTAHWVGEIENIAL